MSGRYGVLQEFIQFGPHHRNALRFIPGKVGCFANIIRQIGGWPDLESGPAPPDSGRDGIPDVREQDYGLNSNDPADRNATQGDGYTNLEHYLISLPR